MFKSICIFFAFAKIITFGPPTMPMYVRHMLDFVCQLFLGYLLSEPFLLDVAKRTHYFVYSWHSESYFLQTYFI